MTKTTFIRDLTKLSSRERFETILLVRSKETREKKNGLPYLRLLLADKTGSIDTKIWDNVTEISNVFQANDFVRVKGRVEIFNKQHQAVVTWLRRVPEDTLSLADFLPHTESDIESMYSNLLAAIGRFSNPDLRRLLGAIFRDPDFARLYKRAPAAMSNHHAKIGGLLEHVTGMLRVAETVASLYPEIDGDLLACGVLLHDAGKVYELTSERSFEYTDDGQLLGHIAMGTVWLNHWCDRTEGFPPRLKTLLLHLVLSHHGKQEFGSPVIPRFPEAMALNFIDDLSSKLEMMRDALAGIAGESVWSARHRTLGRSILDTKAFLRQDGDGRPERKASEAPELDRPAAAEAQPQIGPVAVPAPPVPVPASVPAPEPPPAVAAEARRDPVKPQPRTPVEPVPPPAPEADEPPAAAADETVPEPQPKARPEARRAKPEVVAKPSPSPAVEESGPKTDGPPESPKPKEREPAAAAPSKGKKVARRPVKALRPKPAPLPSKVPPSTANRPAPPPLPMQPTLFPGHD